MTAILALVWDESSRMADAAISKQGIRTSSLRPREQKNAAGPVKQYAEVPQGCLVARFVPVFEAGKQRLVTSYRRIYSTRTSFKMFINTAYTHPICVLSNRATFFTTANMRFVRVCRLLLNF